MTWLKIRVQQFKVLKKECKNPCQLKFGKYIFLNNKKSPKSLLKKISEIAIKKSRHK